jgi:hypothetical protein
MCPRLAFGNYQVSTLECIQYLLRQKREKTLKRKVSELKKVFFSCLVRLWPHKLPLLQPPHEPGSI